MKARTLPRLARRAGRSVAGRASTEVEWLASRRGRADVAVFHEFVAGPWGGGNQFLRALVAALEQLGLTVETNRVSGGTPSCLYNSFTFDFRRLRKFAREGVRMVHRVDGPIGAYRGFDDGSDRRIVEINRELADVTVFQSHYSLEKHRELGLELRQPVVIPNAVDSAIFHPPSDREPPEGRKVRLIATSWSDNLRKGADAFAWLDANLDRSRYEATFVGRSPVAFEWIRTVGPLPSRELAGHLRAADVFVAASLDDPCSNAVLEALACGLPVAFRRSGGHPELVGEGGIGFDDPEELGGVLDRLVVELEARRDAIRVTPLAEVARHYLEVLAP